MLNDDTFIDTPVIDELVETFNATEASIVSPNILYPDGSDQCCGRPKINWVHYILKEFKLWSENKPSKHTNQQGVFQSYNVLGAAFMIKTAVFKELGWFDERYFFCPEDLALSTAANKRGYHVVVNSDVKLYHIGGGSTWSKISAATKPASMKGSLIFHADSSKIKRFIIEISQIISNGIRYLYYLMLCLLKGKFSNDRTVVFKNSLSSVFMKKTPKELFQYYFEKMNSK